MDRHILVSLALVMALMVFVDQYQAMATTTEIVSNPDMDGSGNSTTMQQFIGGRKKRSPSKGHGIVVMPIDGSDDDDDRRKKRDV